MPAPAAAVVEWPVEPQLSTDYLNRYSEALMLIEMAAEVPDVLDDLKGWIQIGYREHFAVSQLRCAPAALRAFDRLDPVARAAFESLCTTMNRLIVTATALLAETTNGKDAADIADVASDALRRLIGRATQFINANGIVPFAELEDRALQNEVDTLFGR